MSSRVLVAMFLVGRGREIRNHSGERNDIIKGLGDSVEEVEGEGICCGRDG